MLQPQCFFTPSCQEQRVSLLSSSVFLSLSFSFKKSSIRRIALLVAMARLISRPKFSVILNVRMSSFDPYPIHIVPTGISAVPPPGPATPVTAMAKST